MARPAATLDALHSPRLRGRPLVAGLTLLPGVGRARACLLAARLGVSPDMPLGALHPEAAALLARLLGAVGDPREAQRASRGRLLAIAARRGLRAAAGLPVRGQRTHGGAKTARRGRAGPTPGGTRAPSPTRPRAAR